MKAIILKAILDLLNAPSPAWGETMEAYKERMNVIAEAVDLEVVKAPVNGRRGLAIAVIVTFWGESRFSPFIHSGAKLGDTGTAICMGQHKKLWRSEEEWRGLAGTSIEETRRCVRATAETLVKGYWHCARLGMKENYLNAFVLYGTGQTCRPEESKWKNIFLDRGEKWRTLMRRYS